MPEADTPEKAKVSASFFIDACAAVRPISSPADRVPFPSPRARACPQEFAAGLFADAAAAFTNVTQSVEQLRQMRVPDPYASQLAQFERVAKANTIACRIASVGRFLTEQVGVGDESSTKTSVHGPGAALLRAAYCTVSQPAPATPVFHTLLCSSVFLTLRRTRCFQRSSRETGRGEDQTGDE